jgi:NodT family efflux transporter outer membrane factor (OMF) lipoprotein
VGVTLLAGGCINLNDPPNVPKESKVPVLETWAKMAEQDQGAVQDNWVQSFEDPELDALVREALQYNPNIQLAAARRDQAVAIAKRVGADLWPTVDALGGLNWGAGTTQNNHFLTGVVNWELDLWGRVRYLTRAAEADLRTAQEQLEFARQSIAAQVAQTYYLAVANRLRLDNANYQLTLETEIDRIEQAKLQSGQVDKFGSELSKSDLTRFKADVENFKAAEETALRALEVLLGRFPATEVEAAESLPEMTKPVPAGVPASLLGRRPDVMAAQDQVASAFFKTESARANLLPRIALTANGGWSSTELDGLLSSGNLGSSIGANIAQPVFDAGARFADIESAKAVQQQTLAQYVGTVLQAFREVQDGLANLKYFGEQTRQLKMSDASMDVALPLAETKYRSGDLSLLNLKQVQTQAYQTKDAYIVSQFSLLQQRIQLHRALGGSIIAPPTTQPAATQPAAATQPVATR